MYNVTASTVFISVYYECFSFFALYFYVSLHVSFVVCGYRQACYQSGFISHYLDLLRV